MVGLEPTRPHDHRILSAARIPFHHIGINKLEPVMLRPIVDVKPFTSSLTSNCLVMSEDNQSAPVSSHQILSGRQTPAVTHLLYRVSDFELGEDYPASDNVSSHSAGISSGLPFLPARTLQQGFHLYFRISPRMPDPTKGQWENAPWKTLWTTLRSGEKLALCRYPRSLPLLLSRAIFSRAIRGGRNNRTRTCGL